MMIQATNFQRLSLDDKLRFSEQVISIVEPVFGEVPEAKVLVGAVHSDYTRLRQCSAGLSHPEFTKQISTGDAIRDTGLLVLSNVAKRSQHRTDAKWVAAGELVCRAFHDYGESMIDLPFEKETSVVDKFLDEVDRNADLKAAISTIQCDAWLDDIRVGQNKVKSAIESRGDSRVEGKSEAGTIVARELTKSIAKLFRFINSKVEFAPTPELSTLAERLNEVIARFKVSLKQRKAHLKGSSQAKLDKD